MSEKPWLKFYEPHVPAHVEYPPITLPTALRETANKYPNRTAILFKGTRISYRAFDELADQFAAALQGLGVKKGDRVALHLPNCPQFPIAYYAALRAGAIVVPCNPLYQAGELRYQLNDSGAEVIVTLSSTYPVVKRIRAETNLRHVVVAKIKSYFPPVLALLFTLFKEKKMGHRVSIAGEVNTHWFTDLLREPPTKFQHVPINGEDTAVLMYTGGTTGVPKGAELTHRNLLVNAYQCKAWLNAPEAEEITLTQVPLFHSYGMTTCLNLSVLTATTILLVPDPRDITDVLKTIDKYQPTLYPGVPAIYNAIINYSDPTYNVRSIKACISGAAGLPEDIQQRFQSLTGARLVEGYGLSEASPVTHANPIFGDSRIGTIGVPWPDTEAKIVDPEDGTRVLPPGEIGELCVRGPQIMKGYWNKPDETAEVLWPDPDGKGPWLHTGDLATMDEDGYFRIVDRKKDMILGAGGYNVYPREIEDVLYTFPNVLQVAVVGIPVEGRGERIKAYVVMKPGATATAEEIIEFCRENLAAYKVPKFVEFRSELPVTITGKVLRRLLLEEELMRKSETPEPAARELERVGGR